MIWFWLACLPPLEPLAPDVLHHDWDGDGQAESQGDCDDLDSTVGPSSAEVPADGFDQDCDGKEHCFQDLDGDGHGADALVSTTDLLCDAEGLTAISDDCDDEDDSMFPGAEEQPGDGVDQDCDGTEVCYEDGDGDGFAPDPPVLAVDDDLICGNETEVPYLTGTTGDCDDIDPDRSPDATEIAADGVDQDCDGLEDCYADGDTDGVGAGDPVVGASASLLCDEDGFSGTFDDCDDEDGTVWPGASEVAADGIDQDCDGFDVCYEDGDGDGYAADDADILADDDLVCGNETDPPLLAAVTGDCDDSDEDVSPDASEVVGDGIDQDCDGGDDCYEDGDGDGFAGNDAEIVADDDLVCGNETDPPHLAAETGDCDDSDPDIGPDASEVVGDGIDQDCDDGDACYEDGDGDGYAADPPAIVGDDDLVCGNEDPPLVIVGGDCDDIRGDVGPEAPEVCDGGVDNDCDEDADDDDPDVVDPVYRDADGDGLGDAGDRSCDGEPPDWVDVAGDCDDGDPNVPDPTPCGPQGEIDIATGEADSELFSDRALRAFQRLAIVPDINGDGDDELLVGARQLEDFDGDGTSDASDAGAAFLFLGPIGSGSELDLVAADVVLQTEDIADAVGAAVLGLGDVLGDDGFGDWAVSGSGADDRGIVWVFAGSDSTLPTDLDDRTVELRGPTPSVLFEHGYSLAGPDADGDGRADLVIGSKVGDVFLVLGPLTDHVAFDAQTGRLPMEDADTTIEGSSGDRFGEVLAAVDLDADGSDELAVGALAGNGGGETDAGIVYVFTGLDSLGGSLDPDDAAAQYEGESDFEMAGTSLANAGDVDGDDHEDLLVGAPWHDNREENNLLKYGAVYLVRGVAPLSTGTSSLYEASLRIIGAASTDLLGAAVAGLGDIDDDGVLEVALGADNEDTVYLFELDASSTGTLEAAKDRQAVLTGVEGSGFGESLAGGGDIGGGPGPDLVIGAPDEDGPTADSAGRAYILFGF